MNIPRPEYPRMQFRRESAWQNLNGRWLFAIDRGASLRERGIVGPAFLRLPKPIEILGITAHKTLCGCTPPIQWLLLVMFRAPA